ncbi:PREDICTED: BSD domain-containing protein 1-like [Priapulus caudatus]|uniref:BSD domain-containing protein 1-like n=1 Tax=Priapulus caudatus TaxID=37621 RepID=A0ABM1E3L5_PRICU|nr:PREDICTED: BSD domain-containing protein 1-like [Priapulus caudatus]
MASREQEQTWWEDWLQTAKEKTTEAYELVKNDLEEFSKVMKADTSSAVVKTADTITENIKPENLAENSSAVSEQLKHGLHNMLRGLTSVAAAAATSGTVQDDVVEIAAPPSGRGVDAVFNPMQARLYKIQVNPDTYCREPEGIPDEFECWLMTFDLDLFKDEVSDLLVSNQKLRSLYTRLVPAVVSHAEFWQRYFYNVHQLEVDEIRKTGLKERAGTAGMQEDIGWEDDDEEWSIVTNQSAIPSNDEPAKLVIDQFPQPSEMESMMPTAKSDCSPVYLLSSDLERLGTVDDGSGEANTNTASVSTDKPPVTRKDAEVNENACERTLTSEAQVNLEAHTLDTTTSHTTVEVPTEEPNDAESCARDIEETKAHESLVSPADVDEDARELKTKDKGDMVVVGSGVSSDTSESNPTKEAASLDDWDEDLDMTDAELSLAQEAAQQLLASGGVNEEDEWENWD